MNKIHLYPLKFYPILKEKIWGGNKLCSILGKKTSANNIGESWELSDVENDTSIVTNGALKNNSLKDLLSDFGADIVGVKNYKEFGNKFPLLIKFIDAKKDLSIQLHPNDTLAKRRHNTYGKTEMWYVMQADDNSDLIVGFNQSMDANKYLQHLEDNTLTDILNFDKVKKGDTYFIEAGRIHAIGAGVLLAEIQQTSDITYRVYDWDRVDDEGNTRELHNDLAINAIDFNVKDNFRVDYNTIDNQSNTMVSCQYFTTNYLKLTTTVKKQNNHDSFIIYMCLDGEIEVATTTGSEILKKGETILLPAILKNYSLKATNAEILEVYV